MSPRRLNNRVSESFILLFRQCSAQKKYNRISVIRLRATLLRIVIRHSKNASGAATSTKLHRLVHQKTFIFIFFVVINLFKLNSYCNQYSLMLFGCYSCLTLDAGCSSRAYDNAKRPQWSPTFGLLLLVGHDLVAQW